MTTESKRLKMKRGKFKIWTGSDTREVTGLIDPSGLFGIRRPAPGPSGWQPPGWTATHIPTGVGIGTLATQAKCRAWVAKLLEQADVDWTRSNRLYYERNHGVGTRLRAMLQTIKSEDVG